MYSCNKDVLIVSLNCRKQERGVCETHNAPTKVKVTGHSQYYREQQADKKIREIAYSFNFRFLENTENETFKI